jgi:2-oxoglutarate dehydrogenase E2 component (dihydrolipoamide succinyltransferase)/2-oxoisovalerate dehydrogenase E2 component (dihydrolipoyl transacylase)
VPTDIIMPQLGESIAEGTIVKWLITPGGRVEKDQPLLEVETDKVALEVPSPAAGFLSAVLVPEGQTVPVGTLIARLEAEAPTGVISRVGGVVMKPRPPGQQESEHYSPAVRQLAKERGVDLTHVTGTGEGGRVTKKDVLDFLEKGISVKPAASTTRTAQVDAAEDVVPLTSMRKTIAERMVASRRTAAHVVTFFEADFASLAGFRQQHQLTYLPFVIKAVTRALKDVPVLNSSWSENGIVVKNAVHMGIAVALEDGLLVPVIRSAETKGLKQLAKEVADLSERARGKRLSPEEVQGGTFTITNHGGTGSLFSTPIIHQPQTAILGIGAVQKRPVVINDAIAIRPMCYLSLSFDHRVIDGATADQFMSKTKEYLEQGEWEKFL